MAMSAEACGRGGTVHVVAEERLMEPEAWSAYAYRHEIDCLKIVPSHLEMLLAASAPERSLPRCRLVLGGEAASWDLVRRVERLRPGCRVDNHYGPTETTVGVLTRRLSGAGHRRRRPPLGRPLANVRAVVVDRRLWPSPSQVRLPSCRLRSCSAAASACSRRGRWRSP